jgi:negative regulator of sigma E activity
MPCIKNLHWVRLAAALSCVLALRPALAANAPDDPAAVLRQSIDAPNTISYVGQFETVRFSSNRASATIVKIEHRAPGMTRRWYVAPESLYGDYIVTRGNTAYEFDPKASTVTISHTPMVDSQLATTSNFQRVLTNYRAIRDGADTIADRATDSIVLVNRYTGERAVRVWLDRETHLVLKKEEYHANGAVAAQTRFEELRYTNAIPDGIFSTSAPPGYTETAGVSVAMPSPNIGKVIQEAGFTPFEPKALPQGFTLASGDVSVVNGVKTLHLLYTDGLRSVSLFENARDAAADFGTLRPKTVSFENHDAEYVEDGPTTLLTWKEHGLHFALVGDLLRAELVEIAKSIV